MKHVLFCLALAASAATAATRSSFAAPSASAAAGASAGPKTKPGKTFVRELKRRTIKVTDDAVIELHVAANTPLTLFFPTEVDARRVVMPDTTGVFDAPQVQGKALVLVAMKDLPTNVAVTLQVTLVDGTSLPAFSLKTVPNETDLTVDVELDLKRRVSQESTAALKQQLAEVQSRLDECQQSAGDTGAEKVAALVLSQDVNKASSFTVERHNLRELDKQSRLLVELRQAYRLFDLTYVVLTVENRDPSKPWVLERIEVAVVGGSGSAETRTLTLAKEFNALPPGEIGKYVVAFKTPAQETNHKFKLQLLEQNGNRHFVFDGVKL